MRRWWLGLAPRERRAVALGGFVVFAMLFYVLLWLPPHRGVEELRQMVEAQQGDLEYLRRAAREVMALKARQERQARPASAEAPVALYALVERSAREAGLADVIQRIDPAGDGEVRVGLEQAAFDPMIRWLAGLHRDYGVVVATASVRRGEKSGRVAVQLMLKAMTQ
ncbi:MAG: type II secretion system protein M [Nitrococcus sp.]|nr:type II secretion system protein M [Nitrococcus sp.]